MKKILVNYDCDEHDKVRGVQTFDSNTLSGKTDEDIMSLVKKRNDECGWEIFKVFEISEDLGNVFRFMLGEKEYKRLYDITYVYEKLKDIQDDIESMRDDTFRMSEYLESTINDVEKLVPEEYK